MEQFTEKIKADWDNELGLLDTLIEMILEESNLASQIAQIEASFNSAFINEKEDSYKSTDGTAKARARSLVGTTTKYEYEFTILTQLINLVTSRISQIAQL